jgi:hypothetical protein
MLDLPDASFMKRYRDNVFAMIKERDIDDRSNLQNTRRARNNNRAAGLLNCAASVLRSCNLFSRKARVSARSEFAGRGGLPEDECACTGSGELCEALAFIRLRKVFGAPELT